MPVGFEPPRYALSIGAAGHGAAVLRRAGCFVVNIVPASWEQTILDAGSTSGATGDKFDALRLPTERATFIPAPYLPGAIGRLECVVEDIKDLGDRLLVLAKVVHTEDRGDSSPRLHHQWTG